VNEYHAERNSDVIIFLDSFADARRGDRGRSTKRSGGRFPERSTT
jgi:uncharacterized protein (DUF58 family)